MHVVYIKWRITCSKDLSICNLAADITGQTSEGLWLCLYRFFSKRTSMIIYNVKVCKRCEFSPDEY